MFERIIKEIPANQAKGKYDMPNYSYSILETEEIKNLISADIMSIGTYFRPYDECVIFIKKINENTPNEKYVLLELKKGPERGFMNMLYAKRIMTFTILMFLAGVFVFSIFSSYKNAIEAKNENQKYLDVKRMSFALAHEIRNPLNSMHLSLELMKTNNESFDHLKQSENDECINILQFEIKRLDELVKRFMEYSKEIKLKYVKTSVNKLINSIIAVLTPIAAEKKVAIELKLINDIDINIDFDLIYQSFFNIIKNAIEAAPNDGFVKIECVKVNSNVEIKVADNGPGIIPEMLPRIFDFYFSTKEEGSGIGLALTKKYIESHGGKISVFFENDCTCFKIVLPA
ncbi:MAG: HAMP domain-containing sensor histidine kinase [Candidatus Wallbacteria bacterium]